MYTLKNIKEEKRKIRSQINQFKDEFSRVNLLNTTKGELVSKLEQSMNVYIQIVLKNALDDETAVDMYKQHTLKMSFTKNNFDLNLIKPLYQIRVFDSLCASIEKLLNEQKEIHQLLDKINPLFSIFWFFNGAQKKQDVVENANFLNAYIEKLYGKDITDIENQIWHLDNKAVIDDYKEKLRVK